MSTEPYRQAAVRAARRHGIPTQLFKSLVTHESGWQPDVESSAGAVGLTQLMPATAAYLKVNPRNPIANLDGGARYLREQYDRFGSWRLALAAYNAGPGNVENGEWKTFPETQHYVSTILGSNPRTTSSAPPPAQEPATVVPTAPLPSLAPLGTTSGFGPGLGSSGLFGTDMTAEAIFQGLGRIAQGAKPTDTLGDVLAAPTFSAKPVRALTPPKDTTSGTASGVPAPPKSTASAPPPKNTVKAGDRSWLSPRGGINLNVNGKLLDAVDALGKHLGQKITIESGRRSRALQTQLYQRYVNSGYNIRYIAAKPGTSNHEKGQALDLTVNGVPIALAVPADVLAQFGLHNPVAGDNPHTTLLSVTG